MTKDEVMELVNQANSKYLQQLSDLRNELKSKYVSKLENNLRNNELKTNISHASLTASIPKMPPGIEEKMIELEEIFLNQKNEHEKMRAEVMDSKKSTELREAEISAKMLKLTDVQQ